MFDLKTINSALSQLEDERGIPREKVLEAIEMALAAAYKKEYGKKGQIVRATFDIATGKTEFFQVRIVVDESMLKSEDEEPNMSEEPESLEGDAKVHFNEEHHIMLEDAKKMKKDVKLGEELVFPLESKEDYGRIAAQTAKQVIIQRIREAEKMSVLDDYGKRQNEIVVGRVQRIEKGNVFVEQNTNVGQNLSVEDINVSGNLVLTNGITQTNSIRIQSVFTNKRATSEATTTFCYFRSYLIHCQI